MIQDALSIKTCFELNNDPKNIEITDTTDYAAEGIALTDVIGIFKMVGPDGVTFYTGSFPTPDIDADVSLIFNTVSLPLDVNNEVQQGKYTITYTIRVVGGVQPGDFVLVKDYVFNYTAVNIKIDLTVDCRCSEITSTDTTDYGAFVDTLVRTHTVHSPTGAGIPDSVSSNPIIKVTPITNKTWSSEISTVVTYVFADELCVIDTLTGAEENTVDCDFSLCDIFCCIRELADRYFELKGVNDFAAAQIKQRQLDDVITLTVLFDHAITCGNDTKADFYHSEILRISQCQPDCSCDDDKPTLIIPICGPLGGGNGDVVVAVCGNGAITLTTGVVGSTTTYTLCFDQDLLDKLNASFNTDILAGTGISVGIVVDPQGNQAVTITNTQQESDKTYIQMDVDFGTSLPSFVITAENIIGTKFQAATLDFKNSSNFADYSAQNNEFEVKDFLTTTDPINPSLNVVGILLNFSGNSNAFSVAITSITSAGGGNIKFQIFNTNGVPLSGGALNRAIKKITLSLNINSF